MKSTILVPNFLLPRPQARTLAAGLALAIVDERIAQIDTPDMLRERWPAAKFIVWARRPARSLDHEREIALHKHLCDHYQHATRQ